jgi:hypothetical protein
MREAVLSGAVVPRLVRRSARSTLLADIRTAPDRRSRHPSEFLRDYCAAGETDLGGLGFAAGLRLSIGTANDRPNMSL